jgi:hypothetical protein
MKPEHRDHDLLDGGKEHEGLLLLVNTWNQEGLIKQ